MSLDWFENYLVCPRSHSPLNLEGGFLVSAFGIKYPIIGGVPVILLHDVKQTMGIIENSIRRSQGLMGDPRVPELYLESLGITEEEKQGIVALSKSSNSRVDPVVSFLVGATNGIAYKHLIGKLDDYPIPDLPLPRSDVYGPRGFWAIEVKNSSRVRTEDLRSLRAFGEDYPESRLLFLYRGKERTRQHRILCVPCEDFLSALHPNREIDAEF